MVPLILLQTPQKRCDLWKRVVLRRPLKVLGKSHHLEHRRCLVPCGSNYRHCRFPSIYSPSFLRQHFPKLLPSLRQRTDPIVLAAIGDQTVDCFAGDARSNHQLPRPNHTLSGAWMRLGCSRLGPRRASTASACTAGCESTRGQWRVRRRWPEHNSRRISPMQRPAWNTASISLGALSAMKAVHAGSFGYCLGTFELDGCLIGDGNLHRKRIRDGEAFEGSGRQVGDDTERDQV
jgi:hypothetical protein